MSNANLEATTRTRKALAGGDERGCIERLPLSKALYTGDSIRAAIGEFADRCDADLTADETSYHLTIQVLGGADSRKVFGDFLNALLAPIGSHRGDATD